MSRSALKGVQAAAGNAGGAGEYVDDLFSTYLYEGNGSTQTITNDIDLDGEGGLVWIKDRSFSFQHRLYDTERGATKSISSHDTTAEFTISDGLTAFNEGGFSVGSSSTHNASGKDYVSWTFRKQPGFFDVVTYTGDGVGGRTVNHNLGSVPGMIIIKRTDAASTDWIVYHRKLNNGTDPEDYYLILNGSGAENNAWIFYKTAPTDTTFTVGNVGNINASGGTYVAYLFAHNDGDGEFGEDGDQDIIKCGSFTLDGSGNPASVNLGFEPQWLLVKRTDSSTAGNWYMEDIMRGLPVSGNGAQLYANTSGAESASNIAYPNATGFTWNIGIANYSAIYIAIRRPMKTPESGTEVFDVQTRTGTGSTTKVSYDVNADLVITKNYDAAIDGTPELNDRMRGANRQFRTNNDGEETTRTDSLTGFDVQNGVEFGSDGSRGSVNANNGNYIDFVWQRATGFFDVVAYEGTGSNRTIAHNLGVAPEMMIIKARESLSPYVAGWVVYHSGISPADSIYLSEDGGSSGASFQFASTAPTDSVFTLGSAVDVNMSGKDFISYHFASADGISKVGSYTGTGSDLNVDCGFSAGARFVLIKRTDSTGDWYVWDSVRGIVAGNDPYLLLNSTAAEVTSTDYIDPLSSGFTVTSSAPAALNASGGDYIFLAIA